MPVGQPVLERERERGGGRENERKRKASPKNNDRLHLILLVSSLGKFCGRPGLLEVRDYYTRNFIRAKT